MLGFPFDGPDCGRIAAQTLRKIGFDIVSFFIMTPLPGTEDQVRYAKEGDIIDWDFNKLDSQHVTLQARPRLDTRLSGCRPIATRSPASTASARPAQDDLHRCGGRNLNAESRRSTLRQFCTTFSAIGRDAIRWSAAYGRFVGVTCVARRSPTTRRCGITSAGVRFDAILRGDGGGFAAAPA